MFLPNMFQTCSSRSDAALNFPTAMLSTLTVQLNIQQPDKDGNSKEQLIKISANDNISINPSEWSSCDFKISARGHASHKAKKTETINKLAIITSNTTRLQCSLVRIALETTRG